MKDIVLTDRGPKPIGPYSQAVQTNGFVFVSGQIALDPKSNGICRRRMCSAQTERSDGESESHSWRRREHR